MNSFLFKLYLSSKKIIKLQAVKWNHGDNIQSVLDLSIRIGMEMEMVMEMVTMMATMVGATAMVRGGHYQFSLHTGIQNSTSFQ